MLAISATPILTPRLELRRTRVEDAEAMFDALRDPAMYAFIPRDPPQSVADVSQRFARITQEVAPDRDAQWLNWTVWRRESSAPIGMTEATISPGNAAQIAYMIDPRHWRRGYASEAVAAMLEALTSSGAVSFEACLDVRNHASRALMQSLGFTLAHTADGDEIWRRQSG
jgi:ribosomal-protein-alanine N-acetyltransferase